MIKFFPKDKTNFSTLGLSGVKVLSAEVYEEINGAYTLEVTVPADETRISEEMIICAPTPKNGMQPFRIHMPVMEEREKKTFYARHIFYDLLDNFLDDCRVSGNGADALDDMLSSTQYSTRFTYTSNVTKTSVAYWEMMNPVEAIIGADNSLVNRWGGEIERDGWNIGFFNRIGRAHSIPIRYAKNLQAFELQTDMSNVITRIMPTGLKADGQTLLKLPERYVDSQRIGDYIHPKVERIHYSDVKVGDGEDEFATEALAQDELRRRAAAEFENGADLPTVTGQIAIIDLSKIEEYKDIKGLEKIYLGDTLNITNITSAPIQARVVAYHYDALAEEYKSIEVGTEQKVIGSSIRKNLQELSKMMTDGQNFLEMSIEEATALLTSALGGYVLKRNGEILIMDTEDPLTCTKCWRFNLNGLGYSGTGYNGPYTIAITMDGKINASLITTGELDGAYIRAGSIQTDKLTIGRYFSVENDILSLKGIIKSSAFPNYSVGIGSSELGQYSGAFSVNSSAQNYGTLFQVYEIEAGSSGNIQYGTVWTAPFLNNSSGTNRKGIRFLEKNLLLFNDAQSTNYSVGIKSGRDGVGCSIGCSGNYLFIGSCNTYNNLWINYYAPPYGGNAMSKYHLGDGTQGGYASLYLADLHGEDINGYSYYLRNQSGSFSVNALYLLADNSIALGDYSKNKDLCLYGKKVYVNGTQIGV